jgi:hypothetical protein
MPFCDGRTFFSHTETSFLNPKRRMGNEEMKNGMVSWSNQAPRNQDGENVFLINHHFSYSLILNYLHLVKLSSFYASNIFILVFNTEIIIFIIFSVIIVGSRSQRNGQ